MKFIHSSLVGAWLEVKVKRIQSLQIGQFGQLQIRRGDPVPFGINFSVFQKYHFYRAGLSLMAQLFMIVYDQVAHVYIIVYKGAYLTDYLDFNFSSIIFTNKE